MSVEAAIALSALTAFFLLLIGGLVAMVDQLRCADAAREAARLVARGQPESAERAVREIGPVGAEYAVRPEGDAFTVEVVAGAKLLPGLRLNGHAYAMYEPEVAHAPG
ncbi:pilus assembly protein [Saccharothrix sp. AJ9571]|nr:pilus assembly protein [Saccharothrix sp. AJ9571]